MLSHIKVTLVAPLASLMIALVACNSEQPVSTPAYAPVPSFTSASSPTLEYLAEEIPPCTPVPGSSIDPCELGVGRITDSYVSEDFGTEPFSMRFFLDGERGSILNAHLVVRGTYLPGTVRCIVDNDFRSPSYASLGNKSLSTGVDSVNCFADVRVNSYILGSGPPFLTVLVKKLHYWMNAEQEVADQLVGSLERAFNMGGNHPRIDVPADGIAGREAILFIGPEVDVTIEAWRVFETWDVQQQKDGTVIAVHPDRDVWRDYTDDYETYRSRLEMDLPTFAQTVTTANQSRLAEYGGRIGADADLPMLVNNVNQLRQYYTEVGAYAPGAPVPAQPPPPCGLAVPDQADNPGLMRDCINLLAAKDTLRGTATLNWSVDTPISDWDGVTVQGSPSRVKRLVLVEDSLTGTLPPELGRLDGLEYLWLGYNQPTGEIPAALGGLSNLKSLTLNQNRLTGAIPRDLGRLSRLEAIWLNENQLNGEIPASLGDLGNLRQLLLAGNRLSGAIPSVLGDLSNLEHLKLNYNQLTGEIPAALENLSNLEDLLLGDNQLTGCVPPALRNVEDNDFNRLGLQDCAAP